MRTRIARYRRTQSDDRTDFTIGCRVLVQPFFFDEDEWIPVPPSWSKNIVSFKTYSTADADGAALWTAVQERISSNPASTIAAARYGEPTLTRPRLGQGAFRKCSSLMHIIAGAPSRVNASFLRSRPRTPAHTP
jgi:putative restriction endonuclease